MKKLTPWMLIAFLGMVGCSSNNDDDEVIDPLVPVAMTKIQIVHASPDAPTVDLLLDGAEIAGDVDYKQATGIAEIVAGSHIAEVKAILPDGTTIDAFPAVTADLTQDLIYSVLAVNDTENLEALILTRPDIAVTEGNARVQIVHAAPQAPMVDIYVTAPDADLAQSSVLVTASFKDSLDATEVPVGDYQIRITLAGDVETVVYDSGTITLPSTSDFLIAAIENTGTGDQPVNLLLVSPSGAVELLDAATPAAVRVIHGSADAPAVDIIANDNFAAPLIANLAFTEFAGYVDLAPAIYNVKVVPTGTETPAVIDADLDLAAGIAYNVLATDALASIQPLVFTADNRRVATEAKLRIVHGSPTAMNVDIYLVAPGTDISTVEPTLADVAFLAVTDFISVAAGSYDVVVAATGSDTPAIGPATITLANAGIYTAIASDAEGGGVPLGLILLDDFVAVTF
ncbi:MAG: hypothetical protein ACJAS9_001929 [Polaribacter sp.]|jgi:hypothetical protein